MSRGGLRKRDLEQLIPRVARILLPDSPLLQYSELQFAALRRGFRAHLVRRGAEDQWDFFHAQTRAAVDSRLLGEPGLRQHIHSTVADHLERLPADDVLREELMFHLIGADDRARAAQTEPIEAEIKRLGLPLIRWRKLNAILNALIMQIEDGGDSPKVNRLLLDALREGLRHQVGSRRSRAALRAIDAFERAEAQRWEQVMAGALPPIELTPEEGLNDLMQEGYRLLDANQILPMERL